MTNHDDLHDIETRLRASLHERAGDVDTTPALYERVQQQATRGTWVRRGFALAAAAAVVAGAFAIVPSLLPDPAPFDVVDTPEESLPSDGPTADEDAQPALPEDTGLTATLLDLGIAHAEDDGAGGSVLYVRDRVVRSPVQVVSLATDQDGGTGLVVAGRADGSIGVVTNDGTGDQFDLVVEASANGSRAVATPGADGIAWIEGRDLHVLPLEADGAEVRVLPLEGDVPDDLQVEQWVSRADAQVLLATSGEGGLWSIPMDDSSVSDTAPTTPALVLEETAVDGAILPNLVTVTLRAPVDGSAPLVLAEGDDLRAVPTQLPVSSDMELTTGADGTVVLLDRLGTGVVLPFVDGALGQRLTEWQSPRITAAVALGPSGPGAGEEPSRDDPSALGLPTDAPLVATDGIDLVIRSADGSIDRRTVYRPAAESEAELGDLAVRPGSTASDGLVAVESFSEGETSVRFVQLDGDTASPVGSILVTTGPVSGLVWADDGSAVAWTDDAGLNVVTVEGDGEVPGAPQQLATDPRPVLDWTWTGDDGTRTSGSFAVLANGTGTEFLGVDRFRNGEYVATFPGNGSDRLVFDTHATPGAAIGPDVSAELLGFGVDLRWGADGDQFGELASPGVVGGDVRVEVSGGQVVVMGSQQHVLVTFDGDVVELPMLTDWDVLD